MKLIEKLAMEFVSGWNPCTPYDDAEPSHGIAKDSFEEGFRKAREMAAEEVESYIGGMFEMIGENIRKLGEEEV